MIPWERLYSSLTSTATDSLSVHIFSKLIKFVYLFIGYLFVMRVFKISVCASSSSSIVVVVVVVVVSFFVVTSVSVLEMVWCSL